LQNFFGRKAAGGRGETIHIWRTEDGALEHALAGHDNDVHGIQFSPDGKWLASASEDGTAVLWRIGP
jgi:WD40 repeat protein